MGSALDDLDDQLVSAPGDGGGGGSHGSRRHSAPTAAEAQYRDQSAVRRRVGLQLLVALLSIYCVVASTVLLVQSQDHEAQLLSLDKTNDEMQSLGAARHNELIAAVEQAQKTIEVFNRTQAGKLAMHVQHLDEKINSNLQSIGANANSIKMNEATITTATSKIQTNQQGIATNQKEIQSATQRIKTNEATITTATGKIHTNEQDIATNQKGIQTAMQSITTATKNIQHNIESIGDMQESGKALRAASCMDIHAHSLCGCGKIFLLCCCCRRRCRCRRHLRRRRRYNAAIAIMLQSL